MMRLFSATIAALSVFIANHASAQTSPETAADRIDSRIDRRVEREPRGTRGVADSPPITVTVSTPLKFTTNAANSDTNTISSVYVDPTIEVAGEWTVGAATLTTLLSADNQLFLSHSENDNSTLLWQGRLTAPAGAVSLYADYTGFSLFDGSFEGDGLTVHNLAVGGKLKQKLSNADTLSFDLSATRRRSKLETLNSNRFSLSARWIRALSERTALTTVVRGRIADFTASATNGRSDKNLLASLSWGRVSKDEKLAFGLGASFERNWSNIAGKDYSVWEAGPTVSYTF